MTEKVKIKDLVRLLTADRSIRRFDESRKIERATLEELTGLTRLCASGRNAQALRYRIVTGTDCERVFPHLKWAGYYKDWDGPEVGQRPVAYLVQCVDTEIAHNVLCDDGIQLQAITLGATTLGIGCCIIKAFDAAKIAESLRIAPRYKPQYVLALGFPAETARIVEMADDGDFKYFRDENDVQCVPKRPLRELIM